MDQHNGVAVLVPLIEYQYWLFWELRHYRVIRQGTPIGRFPYMRVPSVYGFIFTDQPAYDRAEAGVPLRTNHGRAGTSDELKQLLYHFTVIEGSIKIPTAQEALLLNGTRFSDGHLDDPRSLGNVLDTILRHCTERRQWHLSR